MMNKHVIAICGNSNVGKTIVMNQFDKCEEKGQEKIGLVKQVNANVPPANAYVLVFNPAEKKSLEDLHQTVNKIRLQDSKSKIYLLNKHGNLSLSEGAVTSGDVTEFLNRNQIPLSDYLSLPNDEHTVATRDQGVPSLAVQAAYRRVREGITQPVRNNLSFSSLGRATLNASFHMKVLAAISGVLLLASLIVLTLGTCGVGTAAVAFGLTVAGAVGTTTIAPLFGYSLFNCHKVAKIDRLERSFEHAATAFAPV